MSYYDEDNYYVNDSYYDYDNIEAPLSLTAGSWSEKEISEILILAGLTEENRPIYVGNMEKLVFLKGNQEEVYSSAEIRFIESVENVYVFPDFYKELRSGEMVCRAIVTKFCDCGYNAIKQCIAFEKIIDKALDGFNIFLFVTDDSVMFGCRLFKPDKNKDCIISRPIYTEQQLEKTLDEMLYYMGADDFNGFYNQLEYLLISDQGESEDYEAAILRRRSRRYSAEVEPERSEWCTFDYRNIDFSILRDEVEEYLSFIKSNRVNTYEMLFEADEISRQADAAELENEQIMKTAPTTETKEVSDIDERMLSDPEAMIKLLKKRRGL